MVRFELEAVLDAIARTGGIAEMEAALEAVERKVEDLDGARANVHVAADTAAAERELAAGRALGGSPRLGGTHPIGSRPRVHS